MRNLPLLFLALAIISCVHRDKYRLTSDESKNIDSLSVISQMITAIPLETNSQCVLSDIKQVKTAQSNIFIQSGNDIFRFNRTGLFINKITLANNARIYKYAVNSDNQQIIVLDSLSLIHFYAFDGTLLFTQDAEATLAGQTMLDLAYHNHFLWAVTSKIAANNAIEKWMYKLDLAFSPLEGTQLAAVDLGRFYLNGSFASELYVSANKVYVYTPFAFKKTILQDTLYLVSSGKLNQDQMFPYKEWNDFPAYSIPLILGTRYLFASYQTNMSESENYLFCYDTKTNQSFSMNGFKDDFYHTGIVKDLQPLNPYSQEYYFYKSGKDVSASFPDRDVNANPVLFVVRLNG